MTAVTWGVVAGERRVSVLVEDIDEASEALLQDRVFFGDVEAPNLRVRRCGRVIVEVPILERPEVDEEDAALAGDEQPVVFAEVDFEEVVVDAALPVREADAEFEEGGVQADRDGVFANGPLGDDRLEIVGEPRVVLRNVEFSNPVRLEIGGSVRDDALEGVLTGDLLDVVDGRPTPR